MRWNLVRSATWSHLCLRAPLQLCVVHGGDAVQGPDAEGVLLPSLRLEKMYGRKRKKRKTTQAEETLPASIKETQDTADRQEEAAMNAT
eukprot:1141598-Pelagomonas_calceolata.AAC.9